MALRARILLETRGTSERRERLQCRRAADTAGIVAAQGLSHFIASPAYPEALASTHVVWAKPAVLETAGVFVFLSYLSMPPLLLVRPPGGALARSALDGEAERRFLLSLLGLAPYPGLSGGIANPTVRRLATALRRTHESLPLMQSQYMEFVAGTLALSAPRVWAGDGGQIPAPHQEMYWRYISHAMSLLGVRLAGQQSVEDMCRAFDLRHAAPSEEGTRLLCSLEAHHPRYVRLAEPILFESSRSVIRQLRRESHGH